MSTYAGKDNCTNILLDFIAKYESAGNYNAVIGNAHATDDLSKYTLDDIYNLMTRLVNVYNQPSTAIGRYQIIRKTMQGLQLQKKLPGNTKFTPEIQDELAVHLLIGRGYSQWWRGEDSDEEFAHGLSMEWASLPDPEKDGKSHYDGVGPNHAGTTLDDVYQMLQKARENMPTGETVVSPPEPVSTSEDTSADELNRAELERIRKEYANTGLNRPVVPSESSKARAAPGVMLAAGGASTAPIALTLQYLGPWNWPLPAPTDAQAAAIAGVLLGIAGVANHLYYSYQQRKGNR